MPQKQALRTRSFSSKGEGFGHPIRAKQNYSGVFLSLTLAAATWAIYSPVAHHPFVDFDDQYYVTQNAHVQAGLRWQTFVWSFNAGYAQNWHPLTWLSHALDCQLYGLNPVGHHLTNVAFHVLNVVILFFLLLWATGAMWRSLLVAALFAIHPLNVESVAWVAERKNVLSMFFFLLALGAYGWYARYPEFKRYVVLVLLFILGLAAKPMVITLPFVLLLLDFWPLQRIKEWSAPAVTNRKEGNMGRRRDSEPQSMFVQASLARLIQEKLPLLALCVRSEPSPSGLWKDFRWTCDWKMRCTRMPCTCGKHLFLCTSHFFILTPDKALLSGKSDWRDCFSSSRARWYGKNA
jgi:hypothetical protein